MGLSKGSARLCRQLKCLPQANERIPGTGYYEKDEAAVAKKRIDVAEPLFIEKFGFYSVTHNFFRKLTTA